MTVVDYIAMTRLPIHEVTKRMSRPLCGRMMCNIDMQNATQPISIVINTYSTGNVVVTDVKKSQAIISGA